MELSKSKKTAIYIGCILLMATVQLSAMGLNNTMYILMEQMGGQQYFSLMAVLSTLGMCITAVVTGRLGDQFGRRNTTIIGAVLAMVFMLVMAFTKSLGVFIVARGMLAIGIGIFTPNPFVICAEIYPKEKYTQVAAVLSIALNIATFLGSMIAGVLVDRGLNAIAIIYPGVIGMIGALLVFVNLPKQAKTVKAEVDYLGIVIFVLFISALSLSCSFAGNFGITNPLILAGFAVSVVSLVILYKVEKKAAVPVLPFYLFKNYKYLALCLLAPLLAAYQIVMGTYVPVTGQQIMGLSASVTGVFMMPRTVISIVLPAICAALVAKKSSRPRTALILAGALITVAFAVMMTTNENTPLALPFVLLALTGIAESFNGVAAQPATIQLLPAKDIGVGIGLQNTCRSLGMTIAVALIGSAYTTKAAVDLNSALHTVYGVVAGMSAVAVLIAVFMLKSKPAPAAAEGE